MKNNDLVYLVNAGNDEGASQITNDNSFPALGVLALGTWLKQTMPDLEVVVRDGGVVSNDALVAEIASKKPGLVGVSVLSTSYQNSLKLAEAANDSGAQVVFGNDQAAQLSRKILSQQPTVDFVLGSEYGERPLEHLIRSLRGEKIPLDGIPDLTYRHNGKVVGFDYGVRADRKKLGITKSLAYNVKSRNGALDMFPIVDRTLYPQETHWEQYRSNYLAKFATLHGDKPVTGVTTMNRARGCSRANDKCNFCDMLLDVSYSSPELFWAEVQEAHKQVDANVFYEVCDSFSSFPKLIDGIVKTKPSLDFDPKFFVYAQARDITRNPELVEKFSEMGVYRVNIGLEAGSDVTLQHMKGERDSVAQTYEALTLLHDAGIHVYGSFVLGSEAETPQTLMQTVNWAKRIIREGLVVDVEAQPVLPLPQNYQGWTLRQSGLLTPALDDIDWPKNFSDISELYITNFSGVSYVACIAAASSIRREMDLYNGSRTDGIKGNSGSGASNTLYDV